MPNKKLHNKLKALSINSDYNFLYSEISTKDISEYSENPQGLERYTDWTLIGSGGMKEVYRVYDYQTNRHVALAKPLSKAKDPDKQKFLRESRLIALLDHPGIITLFDNGIDDSDQPYFTMELKEGDSLKQLIKKQELILSEKLSIFRDICDAVSFAHSKKIIHLDLKPDNIQVGANHKIKVCDWGLGKIIDYCDSLGGEADNKLYDLLSDTTLHGQVKGTPGYMAPEQITNGEKNERTDVYGLGSMLYEILTLRRPPLQHLSDSVGKPKDISRTVINSRDIPAGLKPVILKATAHSPAERYSDVDELVDDIDLYRRGFPTKAEQTGVAKSILMLICRHTSACLLGVACSAIVLFGASVLFYKLNEAEDALEEKQLIAQKALSSHDQALEKYSNENELTQLFVANSHQLATSLTSEIISNKAYGDPINITRNAIHMLNKVISKRPNYIPAYIQRAYAYIILQQFDKAIPDLRKAKQHTTPFNSQFIRYAKLKGDNPVLAVDNMLDFVRLCNRQGGSYHRRLAAIMMFADAKLRQSKKEHARVVAAVLKLFNPEWDESQFEYSQPGRLKISGSGFSRYYISPEPESDKYKIDDRVNKVTLLSTLRPKDLDLSNSGVSIAKYLLGLNLQSLNISNTKITNTKITNINYITRLKTLESITVTQGQYSDHQIKVLSKSMNVTIQQ